MIVRKGLCLDATLTLGSQVSCLSSLSLTFLLCRMGPLRVLPALLWLGERIPFVAQSCGEAASAHGGKCGGCLVEEEEEDEEQEQRKGERATERDRGQGAWSWDQAGVWQDPWLGAADHQSPQTVLWSFPDNHGRS